MNLIKKILAIFIGMLIAFIVSEVLLYVFVNILDIEFDSLLKKQLHKKVYPIKEEDFIKWAYVDIHSSFFRCNKNTFSIQRQDKLWIPKENNKTYYINKNKKEKRIFILGESTARLYPEDILEKELLKYFDDVNIINTGMGAYDSYRIEKISREIKKLSPDYVIILIGNNDGYIDPVDINWLPYKFALVRKSKVLTLLSKLICHEKKLTNVENFFQNNILKIINNLKNTNVIFCDLPNNEYFRGGFNIFDNIIQEELREEYDKSIWKNSSEYHTFVERINFIKQISKNYNNVYITNLTDVLKKYTNDRLNLIVFEDECHFTNTTYLLLSKIITKIIVEKEKNIDVDLDMSKEEYLNLSKNEYVSRIKNKNFSASPLEDKWYEYDYFDILFENSPKDFYELCNKYWIDFKEKIDLNIYNKLVVCADVLQNNGKIEQSKKLLKDLMSLVPNNFEAYLIMGYIEYKNNNFEQADKYFSKVKELNKDSYIDVSFLKSLKQKN